MEVMTFEDAKKHLVSKKKPISLLMGNGFSMAYDPGIFSYNALFDFLKSKEDKLLNKLFEAVKTKNFELVMQQLDTTIALLQAFEPDSKLIEQIKTAGDSLKSSLLKSIQELHPEHVYKMPEEKSQSCANFLSGFLNSGGQIFSTNYDLLLYWVLMRQAIQNPVDGFGYELENPVEVAEGAEKEWSDLIWGPNVSEQNVHYLHGALHIFDRGSEILKEKYNAQGYLLDNVKARLDQGSYPIFVTAGNGEEKLAHIRHNRYLSHSYDQLSKIDGYLMSFGFNFGEYDEHIIEAINKAAHYPSKLPPKLWGIYIGVYSENDIKHAQSIEKKFHLPVRLFDAKTANVWG